MISALGGGLLSYQSVAKSIQNIAVAWWAFIILFLIVRVWALVGIWRSAGNHEARGGSPGWALLARALLILGVIASLSQASSFFAVGIEYAKLAFGRDDFGNAAKVFSTNNGTEININGTLTSGTAQKFSALIDKSPNVKLVNLTSNGGRIFEAQKIAEIVKARKLDTSVQEYCESACTLILLSGTSRTADRLAKIGFHQPNFPGWDKEMKDEAIAENSREYIAAGVSSQFVKTMMETPPEKMWYPDHDELIEQGVLDGENIVVGGDGKLEKHMALAAKYINDVAPKKLDNVTRLVRAYAHIYEVAIVNEITVPVDRQEFSKSKIALQKNLNLHACTNDAMRFLVKAGGKFTYRYLSSTGAKLLDIDVGQCV